MDHPYMCVKHRAIHRARLTDPSTATGGMGCLGPSETSDLPMDGMCHPFWPLQTIPTREFPVVIAALSLACFARDSAPWFHPTPVRTNPLRSNHTPTGLGLGAPRRTLCRPTPLPTQRSPLDSIVRAVPLGWNLCRGDVHASHPCPNG